MSTDMAVSRSQYDRVFFCYTDRMAVRSARTVVPVVARLFPIQSVVDFGCGNGGWLAVWKQNGAQDCVGIDGDYVQQDALLIAESEFLARDLATPIDLKRRFDLAQSLEVAEHLPASAARTLVASLTRHAELVLFSAAPPGQGGMNHINEQPYAYWRNLFREQNFHILDIVRPHVRDDRSVERWYRYNTFVFAAESRFEMLCDGLKARRIAPEDPIVDISPLGYRMRKSLLRPLPVSIINGLSRMNTLFARRMTVILGRRDTLAS